MLVSGRSEIRPNSLRNQRQYIGLHPTQGPSNNGGGQQAKQIPRDNNRVYVFAVLIGNENIVHQGHGEIRRHQGGGSGRQGQQKSHQELPLIRLGKTP